MCIEIGLYQVFILSKTCIFDVARQASSVMKTIENHLFWTYGKYFLILVS